ncbi:hypothetical protein MBLNU13_g01410t1 [Cladosporium sp. NU13]
MKESNGKAASQERDTRRPTRHEALLAQVEEIKATLYVSEKDTICPTRDEALRPQLEKIKATLEASSGDKEACTGEKSLFQVLKECIPDESLLKSFLDKRSRTTTRISLISNGGYARKSAHTPQDVWNVVDEKETSENHILIVRDIDSDWCEALCTQYPGSIDRRFILEQILGLDLQLFPGCLYQEIYNSKKLLKEDMDGTMNGRALIGQILANLQLLLDMPKPEIHETQTESTSDGRPTRHAFALTMHAFDGGFRDLISSWMGFFNENLNLTDRQVLHVNSLVHQHLLATAARIDSQTKKARGVHVNWWYESQAEDRGYHSSYISNHNEFKNKHFERLTNFRRVLTRLHRSIGEAQQAFRISAKAELHERGLVLLRASKPSKRPAALEPEGEMEDPTKSQGPADFTKLHTESLQGLQERLDAIKEDLNEEIQLAIGSVQVHDAQTMKKQTTWTVVLSVLAAIYLPMTLVTGIFGMNITEISAEPTAPDAWDLGGVLDLQQREDVKKPLRVFLTELQKKLDAIKEDLNEELQVAIGTVQVREAELTREQTRVTTRQSTWTVALTVLAAVYLPMTLVTGIFGMNNTEISSEATAPNAWWDVGAWAVVAGLTVAGILSHVAISKRRARKRKSDLEANDEGETNNGKWRAEAGKGPGKDSKGGIRWMKQKAKTVRTHKQE